MEVLELLIEVIGTRIMAETIERTTYSCKAVNLVVEEEACQFFEVIMQGYK